MTKEKRIGIVGGYGAIGETVTRELLKNSDHSILISGRNQNKIETFLDDLGKRAKGQVVDANDDKSISRFCNKCDLIINCTAPSWIIRDKVLKGALTSGCDYIDPGLWHDETGRYDKEFSKRGLTGLLHAGWIPDISGILPRYLYNICKKQLDLIEQLDVYLGDRSVWSENAFYDVFYHSVKGNKPGLFKNGVYTPKSELYSMFGGKFYKHPCDIGRYFVTPGEAIELEGLARDSKISHMGCYIGVYGIATMLKVAYIRYFNISDEKAVKILQNAFEKESKKHGTGGAVSCMAKGKKDGKKKVIKAELYEENSVWLTGLVAAEAALMHIDGKCKKDGLYFMCDAIDSEEFFSRLKEHNIYYSVKE